MSGERVIADGTAEAPDAVHFHMRALPGFINRRIECSAVELQTSPTGEASLVIHTAVRRQASDEGDAA